MKKVVLVLLFIVLVMNTTAFAAPQNAKPVSNIQLMDSEELFNQIKNSIKAEVQKATILSTETDAYKEIVLDELEQEKYDDLEFVKDHLTEEERIILAKMMAYRYREAQKVAQSTFENIFSTSDSSTSISIQATYRTDPRVAAYYVQNKPVAQQLYQDYLYLFRTVGLIEAQVYRDVQFASYVKSGGPWDLKRYLTGQYIFLNMTRTGEYIGNHHFGYMGYHAGYSLTYLKIGAGFYQVFSGTSKWEWISSYFDDPRDQVAIEAGYNDHAIDFGKDVFW